MILLTPIEAIFKQILKAISFVLLLKGVSILWILVWLEGLVFYEMAGFILLLQDHKFQLIPDKIVLIAFCLLLPVQIF